jgi:hypothetical protein
MEGVSGADDPMPKLASRYGQPFPVLAIQHNLIEIALDGSEEDIVQSGGAHGVTLPGRANFDLKCTVFALG